MRSKGKCYHFISTSAHTLTAAMHIFTSGLAERKLTGPLFSSLNHRKYYSNTLLFIPFLLSKSLNQSHKHHVNIKHVCYWIWNSLNPADYSFLLCCIISWDKNEQKIKQYHSLVHKTDKQQTVRVWLIDGWWMIRWVDDGHMDGWIWLIGGWIDGWMLDY